MAAGVTRRTVTGVMHSIFIAIRVVVVVADAVVFVVIAVDVYDVFCIRTT